MLAGSRWHHTGIMPILRGNYLMRHSLLLIAKLVLGALVFLQSVTPVAAQSAATGAGAYPNKPITLLHAYSAGGSSSVLLRALAEISSKALGQRMIVEDRPGAGGALAPTHMLKSGKPDGYVLSQMPQPLLRIPHIQKT